MQIHASKAFCISFSFLGALDPDFLQILSKIHIPVVKSFFGNIYNATKIYNSVANALKSITFFVPGFINNMLFKEVGIWISNPRSGPVPASVPESPKYTEHWQSGMTLVKYFIVSISGTVPCYFRSRTPSRILLLPHLCITNLYKNI